MGWLSLVPLKWLRLGAYAALFSAGVWVGIQWNDDTIADLELERAHYDRDQAREQVKAEILGQEVLADFYKAKLETAKGKVTYETLVKLVPAGADCRVPAPAVRLLDAARAGVPYDPARIAGSTSASATDETLYTTGLIEADTDLAGMYNNCRAQIQANAKWWAGR